MKKKNLKVNKKTETKQYKTAKQNKIKQKKKNTERLFTSQCLSIVACWKDIGLMKRTNDLFFNQDEKQTQWRNESKKLINRQV